MTYRLDSDIQTPYGLFEGLGKQPPSGRQLEEYIKNFGTDNKQLADKKSGKDRVTIAQSNCVTAVGREGLVAMIDHITPVDIWQLRGLLLFQE